VKQFIIFLRQLLCVCCLSDFEVKHKEDVERPQSLTVGIPTQHRDQADEIPIESGSVLRQKNEIEMKFGSSPRHSKASPDHSLGPPPSDTARLTPTLEKYCASDILTLTEEVPEEFLDEDIEDVQECNQQKRPRNVSSELSQDMPTVLDAGSLQFQRSFSYRENCQQKQPKASPFFGRSASLRLRGLSDAAKNSFASNPSKTLASSLASFSSTEVCSRLLKEKNQQNKSASSNNKLSDAGKDRKQAEHADLIADKSKAAPLSNVLNTMQLPSQQQPAEVSAVSDLNDTNFKNDLSSVGSLSSKLPKNVSLPLVVSQDLQTVPGSASVSKTPSQQSLSHSSRTKLFAESSHDKDLLLPRSLTENNEGSKLPVTRNTATENTNLVQELAVKVFNEQAVVSNSQPDLDASSSISQLAAIQGASQPLDQCNEAASITQLVAAGHSQSADLEEAEISPLRKHYSFNDKSASFISTQPGRLWRSQSVRDKSSSYLRHTTEPAEVQKVRKLYGRSHPLSKLSGEYLSRDCSSSTTIKHVACDHDNT